MWTFCRITVNVLQPIPDVFNVPRAMWVRPECIGRGRAEGVQVAAGGRPSAVRTLAAPRHILLRPYQRLHQEATAAGAHAVPITEYS